MGVCDDRSFAPREVVREAAMKETEWRKWVADLSAEVKQLRSENERLANPMNTCKNCRHWQTTFNNRDYREYSTNNQCDKILESVESLVDGNGTFGHLETDSTFWCNHWEPCD